MNTTEIWKEVEEFTRYEVSNKGRVRTKSSQEIKAQRKTKMGYMITDLKQNGIKKTAYIHRLVAEAFIENKNNYPCINHIDEDKTNNQSDNLEWCTVSYNNSYGNHIQKISKTKTKKYGKKIKQIDIKTNKIINEFNSLTEGAKYIGVTKQAIVWALAKPNHTAGGYKWEVVK